MSSLIGITVCVNYSDFLQLAISSNHGMFKRWFIVTDPNDSDTIAMCAGYDNVDVATFEGFFMNGAKFNKAGALHMVQERVHKEFPNDWILILDADIIVPYDVQNICKRKLSLLASDGIFTLPRIDFTTPDDYATGRAQLYTFFMAGYFHMYFDKSKHYEMLSHDASGCDERFTKQFVTQEYIVPGMYVHHLGSDGVNWQGRSSPLWKAVPFTSRNKNNKLIYYVVGGDREYAQLLRYSINTIRCFPENDAYDILVLCDPEYAIHLHDLPVRFHLTHKNHDHIQSSMRKTEIAMYANISDYEKVLFLDADTIITGPLNSLFDAIVREDVLYVVPERHADHASPFYHCRDKLYDKDTMETFHASNILPFNAGQFAFQSSDFILDQFRAVTHQIHESYNPDLHFYEQSFMNNHFNRGLLVDYALEKYVKLYACRELEGDKIVHHFCDASVPYMQKLEYMRNCHRTYWDMHGNKHAIAYDTRNQIAEAVSLPPAPHIAEIGTFEGDFSQVMFESLQPGRLYLIDPWDGDIVSGDHNGNNVKTVLGNQLYNAVKARFEPHMGSIEIHRMYSKDAPVPQNTLHLIYIDGDHSYEGVKRDLGLAMSWVRYGGWICGHDYAINKDKTTNVYDFGVKRAVHEFCYQHGFRIWGFMNDGCVSFLIRK